ncbi:DNA (cytosine-5)-methyltransferase 1-like [Ephemera danica]|nr:DNA (cytosine-5)-methyltransferase 1-like [Ephemera danica]
MCRLMCPRCVLVLAKVVLQLAVSPYCPFSPSAQAVPQCPAQPALPMEEPKQDVAEFIPVASTSKASDSHGYPYIPPSKVRRKNDNEEKEATGRDTPEIERNTADNIYCSNNHMCPLDTGIVEKDMILYACGYFKSVGTKCSGKEGGVPVKDVGPIKEWLTIGYNNDTEAAVLVRTECCIALLDVPSEEYAPIFKPLERKIYLTKQMGTIPPNGMDLITEQELIHSAQFLFDRVEGILEDDEDCTPILQSECVTHLMQLAGMLDDGESRSVMKKAREGNSEKPAKPMATKATTTPLVNDVFTKLFNAEIPTTLNLSSVAKPKKLPPTLQLKGPIFRHSERCVTNIMSGTFVMLAPREGSKDRVIARVQAFFYMDRRSFCHVQYFERATATVLGQLANPHELVFTNTCGEVLLRTIREVLDVTYHKHENNWRNVGGTTPVFPSCNGQKQFFYNKMYDEKTCRFEDIPSVDPHLFPPLMCTDENHDPDLYPEKCRKRHPRTEKAEDPFSVARVVAIYTTKANPGAVSDVRLQLAKFYRPEDTCLEETKLLDTRLLLWSKEYFESSLGELEGKCWVRAATELTPSPFEWCLQGPDRFFYHKAYCEQTRTITNIINNQQSDGSLNIHLDEPEEWPTLPHKLRALDVFAGCGGLSLGLHQSGVAESKWAIEVDAAAARAFKLNNPRCVMLQEDCNKLLELMLQKETHTEDGLPLPQKHQALLTMGYQVTFGILQAGNFGVPQTRRRAFILAAAPGEVLPMFPKPTHSFNISGASTLPVTIDNISVMWDALGDLPEIVSGASKNPIKYGNQPISTFQKLMRLDCGPELFDHICKEMNPLTKARMELIPPMPNSDWRDLPNIRMRLSDGKYTEKLYEGKLANGGKRGVCPCTAEKGAKCNSKEDRTSQSNTLIPWCMSHTASRNNQWTGIYGRLDWHGIFATTVTNPEPMGKQCARSQGFPDSFKFSGEILNKHRQIGNAVPPPLACAIGSEIKKAVLKSSR